MTRLCRVLAVLLEAVAIIAFLTALTTTDATQTSIVLGCVALLLAMTCSWLAVTRWLRQP